MNEVGTHGLSEHGGNRYNAAVRYDFSANINPLGMPESGRRVLCEHAGELEYYPDPDCRLLRKAIGEWERVSADWVLTGNGAVELIYGLVYALRPGTALLVAPAFSEYEKALRNVGCDIRYYQLEEADGFVVKEDLLSYLSSDLGMVFLCNPNNPTGKTIQPKLLLEIAQCCEANHILFVVDECFLPFLSKEKEWTMKRYLDQFTCLAVLRAFTKLFAIPGVRLGYLLCANDSLLAKVKAYIPEWSTSQVAQIIGREVVKENDYLSRTRKLIEAERRYLEEELKGNSLIENWYGGEADFLFFKGYKKLYEDLLEQGILIRDCSNFVSLEKGYYRIAVRTHRENEQLVREMKKLSRQVSKKEEKWLK